MTNKWSVGDDLQNDCHSWFLARLCWAKGFVKGERERGAKASRDISLKLKLLLLHAQFVENQPQSALHTNFWFLKHILFVWRSILLVFSDSRHVHTNWGNMVTGRWWLEGHDDRQVWGGHGDRQVEVGGTWWQAGGGWRDMMTGRFGGTWWQAGGGWRDMMTGRFGGTWWQVGLGGHGDRQVEVGGTWWQAGGGVCMSWQGWIIIWH